MRYKTLTITITITMSIKSTEPPTMLCLAFAETFIERAVKLKVSTELV